MSSDREVHSDEARHILGELLNAVQRDGEHVTILRYTTPTAVMVPVEWHRLALSAIGEGGGDAG